MTNEIGFRGLPNSYINTFGGPTLAGSIAN
jgi:hypothetical protein